MKSLNIMRDALYRHLMIWLCFILFTAFFSPVYTSIAAKTIYVIFRTCYFAVFYYFLLLFVFPYFNKNKAVASGYFVITLIAFIAVCYINATEIIPFLNGSETQGKRDFLAWLKQVALLFSFIAFSSLGSYLNWRSIEDVKIQAKKEKGIIQRELNFLKNEFHSHLTFNFLTFCHSKIYKTAPEASEFIIDFSEMLRYTLSNKLDEYVPLSKEIEYIERFISIQKCVSTEVYATFDYDEKINDYYILPRMLAVFVENSFKHGVFCDPETPINIQLTLSDNKVFFQVKNVKDKSAKFGSTNIGINNIKHLLNLFYPDQHSLNISENDYDYSCELALTVSN